jgi:hypothetical protein
MNHISRLFFRHILPLIRDLLDEYMEEEPGANKIEINGLWGWLVLKTKQEDDDEK